MLLCHIKSSRVLFRQGGQNPVPTSGRSRKVSDRSGKDMRKTLVKVGLASAAVLLMSNSADAQTVNQNLNVQLTIGSRAQLTLSTNTLVIPDQDPATVATLDAPQLTVNVGARTASAQPITLTVLAGGNLTGTGGTITINNLTWTAGG